MSLATTWAPPAAAPEQGADLVQQVLGLGVVGIELERADQLGLGRFELELLDLRARGGDRLADQERAALLFERQALALLLELDAFLAGAGLLLASWLASKSASAEGSGRAGAARSSDSRGSLASGASWVAQAAPRRAQQMAAIPDWLIAVSSRVLGVGDGTRS